MRTVQDIYFDVVDQSLYFDAPEGRPSSVTSVEIFPWDASDDADSEWSATGIVESNPNGALGAAASGYVNAASGYGQADARQINVAETAGMVVDRTYLITSADGAKEEWFDVLEVDSAASNLVTARHPLHNAYTTGDYIQTTRITATVDATWVADDANLRDDAGPNAAYRVRWVYVVDGVTHVADTYFNLVRYAGKHGVRPADVDMLYPGWLDGLPTDYRADQGRKLIESAYVAVKMDLHAVWTDDAMLANAEVIDELTRYKCIELGAAAAAMAGGDVNRYQVARDSYQRRLDSLSRITPKVPVRDSTGAAQVKPSIGLSRR
jgi:hypothetical protein